MGGKTILFPPKSGQAQTQTHDDEVAPALNGENHHTEAGAHGKKGEDGKPTYKSFK